MMPLLLASWYTKPLIVVQLGTERSSKASTWSVALRGPDFLFFFPNRRVVGRRLAEPEAKEKLLIDLTPSRGPRPGTHVNGARTNPLARHKFPSLPGISPRQLIVPRSVRRLVKLRKRPALGNERRVLK